MAIETRDIETLNGLYEVEKRIQDEYARLETGGYSKETMIELLEQEETLLSTVVLSKIKLYQIEDSIKEKIGAYMTTDLPLGISPFMTDKTYPYIRLVSRLRYKLKKESTELQDFIVPNQIDLEIGIFYNSLLADNELYTNLGTSLRQYAKRILIDSPSIEKRVVENDMKALSVVDDVLPFQVDLWGAYHSKVSGGVVSIPSPENAQYRRLSRYRSLLDQICDLYVSNMRLYKTGQEDKKADCMMCISYFKAITAIMSQKKRNKVYSEFTENSEALRTDAEYYRLAITNQKDIEETLVPTIRKVDFVYRPKKK